VLTRLSLYIIATPNHPVHFSFFFSFIHPGSDDAASGAPVCEMDVGLPVLRLAAGRFVTGAAEGDDALAVLTPRRLFVFTVRRAGAGASSAAGGDSEIVGAEGGRSMGGAASGLALVRAYEHPLERSAFQICTGPFGGAAGRDAICVMSMDGVLSFFDREVRSFSCFLPSFTVPGPLCYLPQSDAFVTVGTDMVAVCYSYHALASHAEHSEKERLREAADAELPGTGAGGGAGASSGLSAAAGGGGSGSGSGGLGSGSGGPGSGPGSGGAAGAGAGNGGGGGGAGSMIPRSGSSTGIAGSGPLRAEWRRNIGEHAVEIISARFTKGAAPGQSDVIIVGEITLFALREKGGAIVYQRRLDRTPLCARAFPVDARGGSHNLLLASNDPVLDVMATEKLVWGAGLPFEPVCVHVATVRSHPGCLVLLAADGQLAIGYLGTDPTAGSSSSSSSGSSGSVVASVAGGGGGSSAAAASARLRKRAKAGGDGVQLPGADAAGADMRDMDYAAAESEQKELQRRIRELDTAGGPVVDPLQLISVSAQAPNAIDPANMGEPGSRSVTARVVISYSGEATLRNVLISLAVPHPFRVENNSLSIDQIKGGSNPLALPVTVTLDGAGCVFFLIFFFDFFFDFFFFFFFDPYVVLQS
jgi:hypothetical protein